MLTLDHVGEKFAEIAPEIGRTFLIGDGKGREYLVPDEATRLFLRFADACGLVAPVGMRTTPGTSTWLWR